MRLTDKAAHVMSVGTSLLANFTRRRSGYPDPERDDGWEHVERESLVRDLWKFLEEDPAANSAEMAGLLHYLQRGEVGEVYCVATESPRCDVCVHAITEFLGARGVEAGIKIIPSVPSDANVDRFYDGLQELRDAVASFARRRRAEGVPVLLNATGGYKPETAVLLLVGGILGCAVYYRQRSMAAPMELPTLLPGGATYDVLELCRLLAAQAGRRVVGRDALDLADKQGPALDDAIARRYVQVLVDGEAAPSPHGFELTRTGAFVLDAFGQRE